MCERIDIPAARVNALSDLPADEHLTQTGFFQTLQDPAMGRVRLTGVPVRFDGQRPPVHMPPRLGEHTHSALSACGVPPPQIDAWLASGAVIQAPTQDPA